MIAIRSFRIDPPGGRVRDRRWTGQDNQGANAVEYVGQDEAFRLAQMAGAGAVVRKEHRLAKSRRPSSLKRQKEQKRLARALEKREARLARRREESPKPESVVPEPEVPEEGNPPDRGQELVQED